MSRQKKALQVHHVGKTCGKVRHIGNIFALCNRKLWANLREDLEAARYRALGVTERFRDEKPYRICKRCIQKVRR